MFNVNKMAKLFAIAGLAIGVAAISAASDTSIMGTLNSQQAGDNVAASPNGDMQAMGGGHHGGGDHGGGDHGGGNGGHGGGHGGGDHDGGGDDGGNCVPEPASILAMGLGGGLVLLRKRAKKA